MEGVKERGRSSLGASRNKSQIKSFDVDSAKKFHLKAEGERQRGRAVQRERGNNGVSKRERDSRHACVALTLLHMLMAAFSFYFCVAYFAAVCLN